LNNLALQLDNVGEIYIQMAVMQDSVHPLVNHAAMWRAHLHEE